ncbi:phosphatase PAP2 family protein [Aquitalea pelogenes]|uniref:phosphatase PAP2 family protein n=1 Tax=Aquitalea pelogenes TaxID=1293573 RepID=UPI0035B0F4C8
MNDLEVFNRTLFLQINGGADTPAWLIQTAIGMADYLVYLIPILLFGQWLWGNHGWRNLAIKACLVTLLALGVNQGIGLLWTHPRPFMIGLGHTWIPHAADSSFPSDHMTVFAGIGLTLLFDGALGWAVVTLLTGLGVAWARVFLGVHFPMDMAGAVGVVAVSYMAVKPLWQVLGALVTDHVERLYRLMLARPIARGWIRG